MRRIGASAWRCGGNRSFELSFAAHPHEVKLNDSCRRRPPMPSPFPGMNPYPEQNLVWHDFHERAVPLMADMLAAQVDPAYVVKIDEHIYLHELPADARRLLGRGDVLIPRKSEVESTSGSLATMPAPFEGRLPG